VSEADPLCGEGAKGSLNTTDDLESVLSIDTLPLLSLLVCERKEDLRILSPNTRS